MHTDIHLKTCSTIVRKDGQLDGQQTVMGLNADRRVCESEAWLASISPQSDSMSRTLSHSISCKWHTYTSSRLDAALCITLNVLPHSFWQTLFIHVATFTEDRVKSVILLVNCSLSSASCSVPSVSVETLLIVQCSLPNVPYTMYTVLIVQLMFIVQCSLFSAHIKRSLFSVNCSTFLIQCPYLVLIVQCSLLKFNVSYTVLVAHCLLSNVPYSEIMFSRTYNRQRWHLHTMPSLATGPIISGRTLKISVLVLD